jgi:predicted RNA-binding protein
MCEATIYVNGEEDFSEVAIVEFIGDSIMARDILGERRVYELRPVKIDLINNRIDLETRQ